MVAKQKTKVDLEAWVRSATKESRRCVTCNHREAHALLREALEKQIEMGQRCSMASMHKLVTAEFPDLQVGQCALATHIRRCDNDLWLKWSNRTNGGAS